MTDQIFENETFTGEFLSLEEIYDCEFTDCVFENCTAEECRITHCRFRGCSFTGCRVEKLKFSYTTVQDLSFSDCILVGIEWNQLQTTGRFAEPLAKLERTQMKYNQFVQMNFRRFVFDHCNITGSLFADTELNESEFRSCCLNDTEFYRCDLRRADLRTATDYRVDTLTCKLEKAKFRLPDALALLDSLKIQLD